MKFKDPEGLLARLIHVLRTYDLTIEYRPDELLCISDCLSRASCIQCNTDHVNICIAKTEDEVFLSIPLNCIQIKDKDIDTVKELFIHSTNPIKI